MLNNSKLQMFKDGFRSIVCLVVAVAGMVAALAGIALALAITIGIISIIVSLF